MSIIVLPKNKKATFRTLSQMNAFVHYLIIVVNAAFFESTKPLGWVKNKKVPLIT